MSRNLHVGWMVWGDEKGGVASAVLNNASLVLEAGHEISLWSFGPGVLADAARARGWLVHLLGDSAELHRRYAAYGFSPLGVLRRARVVLALRAVLRKGLAAARAPDVLCLPWPDLMPLAGPVARERGIGLVLEMPNTPSRYPLDLNQRVYAWATARWRVRLLANSAFSAQRMARIPGVAIVTPAVDAQRFDPASVQAVSRAALGLPKEAIVLGLIARLDPAKGADLLIAAVAALGDEAADVHLLLVGGPLQSEYAQALRQQAAAADLEQRVHWVDAVSDPERYWPLCNIGVNPRRDAEPFGLSIVEAMLMQRPVLAHSLGQPAATLVEGQTGWLYHQPTTTVIAEALRRALAARADWPAMGQRARQEALRRFAGKDHRQHYLQLLQEQAEQAASP